MSEYIYTYDGSFEGLLCCVFRSYEKKEIPQNIVPEPDLEPSFYAPVFVETDFQKAQRVKDGVKKVMGKRAYLFVLKGFYTCHPEKDMLILKFIRLGMKTGPKITSMLANDTVNKLFKAVQARSGESHKYKGFVRFSIYDDYMVSVIEPKNYVLPEIARHFCDRYPNETFMIYDKTHKAALIYGEGRCSIVEIEDFQAPGADVDELMFRDLWKTFYKTISIDERENPKCRMTHMPKRFWAHMTEMEPEEPAEWQAVTQGNIDSQISGMLE